LAGLLIVTACALAPLAVTAVWASTQVSDTDEYVRTVAPLAADPAVQEVLSAEVTDAILDNVPVEEVTTALLTSVADQPDLPPRVAAAVPGLAGPITSGVESFTRTQVERLVSSDQFATLWAEVNRVAHSQVVTLLEGNEGGAVSAQGDTVTLNLGPIIEHVKKVLVAQGFSLAEKVPTVDRSFVLVQSDSVTKVQTFYRVLNNLGAWLPLVALALLAIGVFVASNRRKALLRGSLGVVAAMLVLGVALAVLRALYAQSTPGNVLTAEAAGNVFDTLVTYLRTGLRAAAVFGLLLALAAFLTGPSSASVGARSSMTRGISSLRGGARAAGWNTGRLGSWVFNHRRLLRGAVLVAGGLVLLFWTRPTSAVILGTALVVVVAVAVVEFLAQPPDDVVHDRPHDQDVDATPSAPAAR
jgi:hypothetical protein